MQVLVTRKALEQLEMIATYIENEWGVKSRDSFIDGFETACLRISQHPYSFPISHQVKGLRMGKISKQTAFFYKEDSNKNLITVIAIEDLRKNPDKLSDLIHKT